MASVVLAAEAATEESLQALREISASEPAVVLTARRAAVLGLTRIGLRAVIVHIADGLSADLAQALADPLSADAEIPSDRFQVSEAVPHSCESAAVLLAKTARLLPAAETATIRDPGDDPELDAAKLRAAEALTRVLESLGLTGADEVHAHRAVWAGLSA